LNIFEELLAQILEDEFGPAHQILSDVRGEANASRLGQAFETRRDIDAVAENVPILRDNLPDIDAYSELQAIIGKQRRIAFADNALDLARAIQRIDGALEIGEQAVPGSLDEVAAVFGDLGIYHLRLQHLYPRERSLFVEFHESRISG
jgi:hypothetical protein